MTLVIDPLGTHEVHFMKDGVAVIDLTGGIAPVREVVPAVAGTVIVRAQSPSPGGPGASGDFELSPSFEPGDVVEVYAISDFAFSLFPPSGENFVSKSTGADASGARGMPVKVRKISATEWVV